MGAVLDSEQPRLYTLESIGGVFARVPPLAEKLCRYLQLLKTGLGTECPNFEFIMVDVPRQKRGSNDCGLFGIKFVEMILQDSGEFEDRANRGLLQNWFSVDTVDTKRQELAAHVRQLAVDQRQPGGEMVAQQLLLPLPAPRVVRMQHDVQRRQSKTQISKRRKQKPKNIVDDSLLHRTNKVNRVPAQAAKIPGPGLSDLNVNFIDDIETESMYSYMHEEDQDQELFEENQELDEGNQELDEEDKEVDEEDKEVDEEDIKMDIIELDEENLKDPSTTAARKVPVSLLGFERYLKSPSKKVRQTRGCGLCRQEGHTRKKCPFLE